MKKVISIILTILMCLTVTACDFLGVGDAEEVALVNKVSTETMQSVVTVLNTRKNLLSNKEELLQGSGIIVKTSGQTAFVLTNNHVIDKGGYSIQTLNIVNYLGEESSATLAERSADDDLALLTFECERKLPAIKLSRKEGKVGDKVVALGAPYGQRNCITLGKIFNLNYVKVESENDISSNVKYKVIFHTAPIDHGSSGGALLNYNAELVGVNFAGADDINGNFAEAYAVPLENVKAFMVKCNLLPEPVTPEIN